MIEIEPTAAMVHAAVLQKWREAGVRGSVRAAINHPDCATLFASKFEVAPDYVLPTRLAILARLEAVEAQLAALQKSVDPEFDGSYAAACRISGNGGRVRHSTWCSGWILSEDGSVAVHNGETGEFPVSYRHSRNWTLC